MNNPDFIGLYSNTLDGFKELSSTQGIALCPFHNDTNASLSLNTNNGLYNCFSCSASGNAFKYANERGLPNPHQYIVSDDNHQYSKLSVNLPVKTGNNGEIKANPTDRRKEHGSPPEDLNKMMDKFKTNLKNDLNKIPEIWDKDRIDEFGLGLDDYGNWAFGYYDDNELIGIKIHKPSRWIGNGKKKWYMGCKIDDYRTDKPLYICEGEKDTITLLSNQFQAISISGGCQSVPTPEMIEQIKKFTIIVAYDNDESGRDGAVKIANAIIEDSTYPVKIIEWGKKYPECFDVYDSFMQDNGVSFTDALSNSKVKKQRGVISMNGKDALEMVVPEQKWIIDNIVPEGCQIVLGGTEGSNKSFLSMQMGMAIANNDTEFLGFDVKVKNKKVLFFDTECGVNRLVQRYQAIALKTNFKGGDRFFFASKVGNLEKAYDMLEKEIEKVKPDIVIFDCLYNVIGGKDGSKNSVLLPILNRMGAIRLNYDLTLWVIAHFNKGGHDTGLHIDRIAGAGALKNWTEHCILITYTNDESIRLMRFDKSRDKDMPKCYYELEWNYPILTNLGVSADWGQLLINKDKKERWNNVLRDLSDDKFTTNDFKNIAVGIKKMSERTSALWLKQMVQSGVLKKVQHSIYKKNLKIRIRNEE